MSIGNNRRRILAMTGLAAGVLGASNVVWAQIPCGYDVTIIQAPETPPFGFPPTLGFGINEFGDVCGYWAVLGPDAHAFVWTPEAGLVTLNPPPGVSSATAADIGDTGVIVGSFSSNEYGFVGYIYQDGRWTLLLPLPDAVWSGANAIGNGQIVGGASHPVTGFRHAVVWEEDGVMFDLGASLPAPQGALRLKSARQG